MKVCYYFLHQQCLHLYFYQLLMKDINIWKASLGWDGYNQGLVKKSLSDDTAELFIYFLINFYYSIADLQCCVSLCCAAQWICFTCTFTYTYVNIHIYIYMYIYIYPLFFRVCSHIGHYRVLSKLPVLYSSFLIVIYFICNSVWPSHFSRVWLCNPVDCSPPDSSVHGILQARILEWVAVPSSRGSSRPRDRIWVPCVSCIGRWVLYC